MKIDELKYYPKLFQVAHVNLKNHPNSSCERRDFVDDFLWRGTPEGYNFWEKVNKGFWKSAEKLVPYLFIWKNENLDNFKKDHWYRLIEYCNNRVGLIGNDYMFLGNSIYMGKGKFQRYSGVEGMDHSFVNFHFDVDNPVDKNAVFEEVVQEMNCTKVVLDSVKVSIDPVVVLSSGEEFDISCNPEGNPDQHIYDEAAEIPDNAITALEGIQAQVKATDRVMILGPPESSTGYKKSLNVEVRDGRVFLKARPKLMSIQLDPTELRPEVPDDRRPWDYKHKRKEIRLTPLHNTIGDHAEDIAIAAILRNHHEE